MEHLQGTIHAIINQDENQLQGKGLNGDVFMCIGLQTWFHSGGVCDTLSSPTMGAYWCSRHYRCPTQPTEGCDLLWSSHISQSMCHHRVPEWHQRSMLRELNNSPMSGQLNSFSYFINCINTMPIFYDEISDTLSSFTHGNLNCSYLIRGLDPFPMFLICMDGSGCGSTFLLLGSIRRSQTKNFD